MSQQLWRYLPHVPISKKPTNVLKRKSEITDKEVLNLSGGLFPVKLTQQPREYIEYRESNDPYVRVPIIQSNNKIGPIYHWVRQSQAKKLYHGDKFNVEPDIIDFTQQQYNQALLQGKWDYKKVKEYFNLLKTFNLNFIIVHDRITYEMDQHQSHQNKITIEDLKQIFFTVTRCILNLRGQKNHSLATYIFDKKYEENRKYQLEKFMLREKCNTDQQRFLINQIRRLQILIKKQEREQINLKKALKLDQIPQDSFDVKNIIPQQNKPENLRKTQRVFSRQQYLTKPLHLPGKIYDKLVQVLHGLNIPDKIVATKQNEQLYDQLRKKILLMFSIQRYIRKKQIEKRLIEQKKKKMLSGRQQQDKKIEGAISSLPKKKVNTNK